MGIDISGVMIVGNKIAKIQEGLPEGFDSWFECAEEAGMENASPWYDAEEEFCYIGFKIKATKALDFNSNFLALIQEKAAKFKELTGLDAKLMGLADVW